MRLQKELSNRLNLSARQLFVSSNLYLSTVFIYAARTNT